MARAAVLGRLIPRRIAWRVVTVRAIVAESPRARTLVLDVPDWPRHRAGQHVDVRLTAEDGYQAQRSYSIASAPELDVLELTVELVEDERPYARRLRVSLGDLRDEPRQSPQYRCSCQGSPRLW